MHFRDRCCSFIFDRRGATALEYSLIAGAICIAIIGAVNGLGTTIEKSFTSIGSSLK